MFRYNATESRQIRTIQRLKASAGTHSPSLLTLRDEMPELNIGIDACFLSNPHATDLFLSRLKADLLDNGTIRREFGLHAPSLR